MFNIDDYRNIIAKALYDKDIISKEFYEKCSRPDYIQNLPGSLRSNDVNVLQERLVAIEDELDRRESILQSAEYRIGVKTRDSARLGKRMEKSMDAMNKVVDSINGESDKIVKNIDALESKLAKVDFDDDLKKNIDSSLREFKSAHNKLFDEDLTGGNIDSYKSLVSDYEKAGSKLNNLLQSAFDSKLINKSDLNKSDISKNINRINKNIDKFEKNGVKISKDVQSVEDNQRDIDYIMAESNSVSKEMDVLLDEFMRTNNKYMEISASPYRSEAPNPQMMIDVGARNGDVFTLLPNNYQSYMV